MDSLNLLVNSRSSMAAVNTFRDEIYYIPFNCALYGTYMARAARCVWDVRHPLNNIMAESRYLDSDGHYHYVYNHGGMHWEVA